MLGPRRVKESCFMIQFVSMYQIALYNLLLLESTMITMLLAPESRSGEESML